MSERVLDERGKACPLPVVEARRALLAHAALVVRVIVDNRAALENVSRLAQSLGRAVRSEERSETEFHVVIGAAEDESRATAPAQAGSGASTAPTGARVAPAGAPLPTAACGCGAVVLVGSSELGRGDAELGRTLMRMFIYTLREVAPLPSAIVFINSGVRLTTEGSPLLDELRELTERGVEVLSCGTCLDFYGLKDKLRIGKVTNMFEIVSLLASAERVVSA